MTQQDRDTSEHIRRFGKSLEREIAKFEEYVEAKKVSAKEAQREQVEKLLGLERDFQEALRVHSKGVWAYQKFVTYITEEKGNILHARPYFRERQPFFTKKISPALKAKDAKALMAFRANFRLIQFLFEQRRWTARIRNIYKRLCDIRNEICVTNTPLAMSRARIFYAKTPKSHLTYMDLAQIAAEGLLSAIDKYVPSKTEPFNGLANIAINRITGNCIESYSQTMLHFYPPDKKKLYWIHKQSRHSEGDVRLLTNIINNKLTNPKDRVTKEEVSQLSAAASCISTETVVETPDSKGRAKDKAITIGESLAADASWQPDVLTEQIESHGKLHEAISRLDPYSRKILKLKGISRW